MKRKKLLVVPALLAIVTLLLFGMREWNMKVEWNAEIGPETAEELRNPERGWYQMLGYEINDGIEYDWSEKQAFDDYAKEGLTLVLLEINLKAYREGEISEYGLETVRALFARFRETRMKAIVRFLYDWDGRGKDTEPADLSLVLRHMEQLGPVLRDYEDTIYTMQGVFLGSWAEMHTSRHLSRDNVRLLANQLLSVTGEHTFLAVRTPAYWRVSTQRAEPPTASEAFGNTLPARLGLFNDGLLASVSDCGTYADNPQLPAGDSVEPWGRDAELDFQETLCAYVPNGGESGLVNEYNSMEQMLVDLPKMHVSYLSGEFSEKVQASWEEQTYTGEGPFQGKSFRDYLGAHLGYRFVLEDCVLEQAPLFRRSVDLVLKIQNTGFANLYHEKQVELLFVPEEGDGTVSLPVNTDVRFWKPGETTSVKATVGKKDLPEGQYRVYLKISEESASYAIRAANEKMFDEELEANYLGMITVK